ncbi:MAG: ankyrin repeat domain-containing protein [Bacteroidales bacterium]|nr:ankyrin repeat domain-containing protein [Bacteroidales bacterium]
MNRSFRNLCLLLALFCLASFPVLSQDIYTAVAEGNVDLTRQFIEKDPGLLNLRNTDLLTPLNLAAERSQVEIAALLLNMGADPTIGDRENSQPVHLAAISGCIPILDMLLKKGVDIDTRDINLMTPLLFAASRGQAEMIRHLVDLGADVKARNITGMTALHMATISGNADILALLVEKGAQVNSRNEEDITPLHSAASYGKTEAVKFLVEHGADVKAETRRGEQPLGWAIGRNSYDAALYLISEGADVNHKATDGFTALHNAAGRGNMAVVKLLIDNGADVNAATQTGFVPLSNASWANNAGEIGRFLILSGADVNPDPCRNNKACTCGPNFRTPLHAACEMGKLDLTEALVSNGAKVNLFSNDGFTPLHLAVKKGNIDVVRYLAGHGAFQDVRDRNQGATELHLAAAMGYGDIAKFLVENGSSPTSQDFCGKTPLDYAFYYGQDRIAYEMLAAGADDGNLAGYINAECPVRKPVGPGEADVYFLGHSGWAIKTQNHFLVFDYFDDARSRKPDHPCLLSGCIDTAWMKDLHLTVFCSHEHADHYNSSIFSWKENNPDTRYILCFNPVGLTEGYDYIPVNGEAELDGMKIYAIKSTDSGGGYLVEADGLVIFHMGDHANGDALSDDFTKEIDLIAAKNIDIDILFGPIRGCSLGTPEQVKAGTYYTLEKLQPALFVPMHSGNYSVAYEDFVEQARQDGIIQPMKAMTGKGDRFHYARTEATADRAPGNH